jgi:UDP:flavonoid glycosyltransferase YjiC (YdhE family)
MRKKRKPLVLIVPHASTALSHLLRSISVAEELKMRGWKVRFVASALAADAAVGLGIELPVEVVPWSWGHNEWSLERPAAQAPAYVATCSALQDCFARIKPDLVIGVPGMASFQAARKLSIPHISVLHGPWLLPCLTDLPNSRGFSHAFEILDKTLKGPASTQLQIQGESLGVEADMNFEAFLKNEIIAIAHDNLTIRAGGNLHPCGFLPGDFGPAVPEFNTDWEVERSCCITFGSAMTGDLSPIVGAASVVYSNVVVLKGVADLKAPPSNVYVAPSASMRSLCEKVGTAVSHGGIGTLGTFYMSGIRQLLIPGDLDQVVNSGIAAARKEATVAGVDYWIRRSEPGRELPPVSKDELVHNLSILAQEERPRRVHSDGAVKIAELAGDTMGLSSLRD